MTDEMFPGEAEQRTGLDNLTYIDAGQSEAELLASLPDPTTVPEDPDTMMVVTSLRIPLGLHRRLREYADAHAVTPSVLIRQWIELQLSAADKPISLADALRVLASLPAAA
jgi:hypothetical protein